MLRIEDLDGPRVKPGADAAAIEDLRWLGLDWDSGPVYQRADLSPYEQALESLRQRGLVYPCRCTRREIEQAQSAPHGDEHERRYPGTCRPKTVTSGQWPVASAEEERSGAQACDTGHGTRDTGQHDSAWRLVVPEGPVEFVDQVAGLQRIDVQAQVGDFVVATKAGLPAYQLAVVVDDARQGVTDVVRGDDLIQSTGRQLWLYRLLELGAPPRWWHLPLVLGSDGRRLAKRHGDTRVAWYRQQGVDVRRLVGLVAYWSGASDRREPMTAREFAQAFEVERLPRTAVTFGQEDHAWLVAR